MRKKRIRLFSEIVLIIFIVIGFVIINDDIRERRSSSFILKEDGNIYSYQIESVDTKGENLIIKGWFFEAKKVRGKEREVNSKEKIGLLLYDLQSGEKMSNENSSQPVLKGIRTSIEPEKRQDINNYFSCEYDYSDCGFIAKVDKSRINLETGKYLIVLKKDYVGESGIGVGYLIDGKLSYISEDDKMILNIEKTDLETIVSEGVCVTSNSDFHMCVYQYGHKLYWIADKDYNFEADGSTYIQFQLDTTQFDKLPYNRIDNGNYFDNLGMNFENYEITDDINCGEYRVSVRELPSDYAITRIVTGYHVNGQWIWQRMFRPNYSLLK